MGETHCRAWSIAFFKTKSVNSCNQSRKVLICKIVLLASIIAMNYFDEQITYTVHVQFNSIPIGTITLKNDLYIEGILLGYSV